MTPERLAALIAAAGLLMWLAWSVAHPPSPPEAAPRRPGGMGTAAIRGCEACHQLPSEHPGEPHAAATCVDCHLGDAHANAADTAHQGLEREPGALSTAAQTCGQARCHVRELATVLTSPMTRGDGLIATTRRAFGEAANPNEPKTFNQLLSLPPDQASPAEDHMRRLCAGCHLGTRRDNRDDAVQGIGSGCAACHLGPSKAGGHPSIDAQVTDDRCLGCHARSSRISLSYQGLAEVRGDGAHGCDAAVTLYDGRPGCKLKGDVHHDAGMGCIDCHLHTEVMGDGTLHTHQADAVQISCESCHGPGAPTSTWGQMDDPVTSALLKARGLSRPPGEAVRVGSRGTPLWNIRPQDSERWVLTGKLDGRARPIPPTPSDPQHSLAGHEALSCASCHSAWVPVCADCHTSYVSDNEQWDFGQAAVAKGAWVETAEHFGAGPPALAVDAQGRIRPATPGMIATLDATAAGGALNQLRTYATLDPHTTTGAGRTCASCHRSPWALGLGHAALTFDNAGPHLSPSHPADRFTALYPAKPARGSQPGSHSLGKLAQWRALRVGVCVTCHIHPDDTIYTNLEQSARRLISRNSRCPQAPWPWLTSPP